MAETILDRIVDQTVSGLPELRRRHRDRLSGPAPGPSGRDLRAALRLGSGFILEAKKSSPSRGVLRPRFDITRIASTYSRYASGISVLTEEPNFQGSLEDLELVSGTVGRPVLMKDFIVHPDQIRLGRCHGADAVLLMLSVLDDRSYAGLRDVATSYDMGVLTEVTSAAEIERAVRLGADLVGINNRDLNDLSVDLTRTEKLRPLIPDDIVVISESGIGSNGDVRRLSSQVDGYLVGSHLMAAPDLDRACRSLVYGENKVCGLTRAEDAIAAYEAGAVYGGLIFAKHSPRRVTPEQAADIVSATPLAYVGVFVDEEPEIVSRLADQLGLQAVQLHGEESAGYITRLRALTSVEVWKAVRGDGQIADPGADRLLLDSHTGGRAGGTSMAFDWEGIDLSRISIPVMLAGGIGPENVRQARSVKGVTGVDLNSKVESSPGVKDHGLIRDALKQLGADVGDA